MTFHICPRADEQDEVEEEEQVEDGEESEAGRGTWLLNLSEEEKMGINSRPKEEEDEKEKDNSKYNG